MTNKNVLPFKNNAIPKCKQINWINWLRNCVVELNQHNSRIVLIKSQSSYWKHESFQSTHQVHRHSNALILIHYNNLFLVTAQNPNSSNSKLNWDKYDHSVLPSIRFKRVNEISHWNSHSKRSNVPNVENSPSGNGNSLELAKN